MPTPTIPDGKLFFNAVTWTGNGTASGRSITGVGFQPDFVWGKARSVAYGHGLYDVARGTGKLLVSNNTNAEATNFLYGYLSSFDSNGFTTTAGSSSNENWNQTSDTYVAWNWKAGGAAVTNTAGSISSQVSANTTSGFSVVSYNGQSTDGTVGHGLGVTPSMIIAKIVTNAGGEGWPVFHQSIGTNEIYLNYTNASTAGTVWNGTLPTSTVFSVNGGDWANKAGSSMIAYCFAQIAGYSAFGSYTGNGSADGPFVYLGFRPRFVMTKKTNSTSGWGMIDTSINLNNQATTYLQANTANATVGGTSGNGMDMLSNGFKIRSSDASFNETNGDTYIYMAFAENPFKYANAR